MPYTPDVPADFNVTLLDNSDLCTLQTCPLSLAHLDYVPNLGGNSFFIAIFGLCIIVQIILTVKFRIWGFGFAMFGGLVLEIIGYVARVQMHYNPFIKGPFLMYLVTLTIGPAFISAAIYLCLSRIVVVYSESVSRFRPATYTLVFIICDFVALLLQAAGGGIASTANTASMDKIGKDIMVAGVSWQVASLVLFGLVCVEFGLRVKKATPTELNPEFAEFRSRQSFQFFLGSLAIATITIIIRSVFRTAELSGGFHGPLANQQVTFMILEGAMIAIASICLTIFHPGLIFGDKWHRAIWTIRAKVLEKGLEDGITESHSNTEEELQQVHSIPFDATKVEDSPKSHNA